MKLTKKERRRRGNLQQLQIALDNNWIKCSIDLGTVQFRSKNKPKIDFMLSESTYIDRDTNKTYRSNMKQFLKWYRRCNH